MYIKSSLLLFVLGALSPISAADAAPTVLGTVDGIPYRINVWDRSDGNHRVLVRADNVADAQSVTIPWRRRDPQVKRWNTLVRDPAGNEVKDRTVLEIDNISCKLLFSARSGKGIYAVYFLKPMPEFLATKESVKLAEKNLGLRMCWQFPTIQYEQYRETASATWLQKIRSVKHLHQAKVIAFEALEWMGAMPEMASHNAFYPMELIITDQERETLLAGRNDAFALFPELREYPIRMFDALPYRWITNDYHRESIKDSAKRNEYLVFQIGVYAKTDLQDISISFSDLKNDSRVIGRERLTSFNHGGNDWLGRPFRKTVSAEAGTLQPLWIGLDIPRDCAPGDYHGSIAISAANQKETLNVHIHIDHEILEDRGDSDLYSLSRLRWLNSTLGIDDEVLPPYHPVKQRNQDEWEILGRRLELGDNGLPKTAYSFIDMDQIKTEGRSVLAAPATFKVFLANQSVPFSYSPIRYTTRTPSEVGFECTASSDKIDLTVQGSIESDGYMRYAIAVHAKQSISVDDVRLEFPLPKSLARYKSGALGKGYISRKDTSKGTPGLMYQAAWIGDYNAGLWLWLKNSTDQWNGDNSSKKDTPVLENWTQENDLPLFIDRGDKTITLGASTAPFTLEKGDRRQFDFAMMVTPCKPLNDYRWDKRIYHPRYSQLPETAYEEGANYINLHHATRLNPYINYPFMANTYLKPYADKLRGQGKKLKLYYTCRELSVNLPELWMLRSLGDEIFIQDQGFLRLSQQDWSAQKSHFVRSGSAWMAEHLVDNYRNRWQSVINRDDREHADRLWNERDCSIATQGLSRWHNYYIEGIRWLADEDNLAIGGLYLDGIGYDRAIMKRIRKAANNPEFKLDYHGSVQTAWLSHAPYLDNIWFGEQANYSAGPDYWLTEVSGIPWGLSGEILRGLRKPDAANHFKGMVFGITRRMGWSNVHISQHLWDFWDQFDIKQATQYGFWMENSPVTTDNEDVKVGVYAHPGKAVFLSIANFSNEDQLARLSINWKQFGLDPNRVAITLPEIEEHQEAGSIDLSGPITVKGDQGYFVLITATE